MRVAHGAAAVDSTVYVHGGRTEVGEDSTLGDLWAFHAASGRWTELKPTSEAVPCARNYHSACAVGPCVYIFGGCGGTLPDGATRRLNDLWRYDTRSGAWQELPTSEAITGRGGPGFAAAAGALWVVGGFTGQEANDVHRFNLSSNNWEQVAVASTPGQTPFTARSVIGCGGHACGGGCAHDGHLLVFGGEIDPSDLGHAGAGQFSDATLCLDPAARCWHAVEVGGAAPGPRGWVASTEMAGRGVIVSGGMDDSNTRLSDLFLLDYHA
jgi:N-acetylneuraminic acid mutarotase